MGMFSVIDITGIVEMQIVAAMNILALMY